MSDEMMKYIKPRNPDYEKMSEAVDRMVKKAGPGVMVPIAEIADEACEFLKIEPGHMLYDEALFFAAEMMAGIAVDIACDPAHGC